MAKKIVDVVKSGKVLVSDGAWGTFLQKKGMKPGECPELWCIDRPDDVTAIAQSYIDAGADMVEANSFGGLWLYDRIRPLDNNKLNSRAKRAVPARV